jgi:hypothetical protein
MKPQRGFLTRSAASLILILPFALAANSQQTTPSSDNSSGATANTTTAVDPKAHDAAMHLCEALELKDKMAADIDVNLDKGVEAMKSKLPNLSPEFAAEWRRRMKARMNLDEFVSIIAQVYEKHFTADELDQLSNAVISKKEGKTASLPDALKDKFQKNAVAIQSEIIGSTTQLGARLGGEVGQEIAKEHPEWVPASATPPAAAVK